MGYGKTTVTYDGTNRGPIYLKDIGQRNQLGGGRGIYVKGQDRYMDWGTDATFLNTSDVMLSNSTGPDHTGVIAANTLNGSFHVTIVADV